jgi:hypothetical protein
LADILRKNLKVREKFPLLAIIYLQKEKLRGEIFSDCGNFSQSKKAALPLKPPPLPQ